MWSVLYHCFLPGNSASLFSYNGTPALDLISVIPEILFSSCPTVILVILLYLLYLCNIWKWLLAAGVPWIYYSVFCTLKYLIFEMSQIRYSPFSACHLSRYCWGQEIYLFICVCPSLSGVSSSIAAIIGDHRSLKVCFQVQTCFHISSDLPHTTICGINPMEWESAICANMKDSQRIFYPFFWSGLSSAFVAHLMLSASNRCLSGFLEPLCWQACLFFFNMFYKL